MQKLMMTGIAVCSGLAVSAEAADLKGRSFDDRPAIYGTGDVWAGFYAGIQAGGAFDDTFAVTDDTTFAAGIGRTWLAGVHVGHNWQTSENLVLGVEAAGNILGGGRSVELGGFELPPSFSPDDNWLASVQGRLGYALGSTLVYATGGVAFLSSNNADFTEQLFGPGARFFDDLQIGWAAGAGVEQKLGENISVGLQGTYYLFASEDDRFDLDLERDFWSVQGRLTYHFGDNAGGGGLK
jgi:outer membrane immunogenic protein